MHHISIANRQSLLHLHEDWLVECLQEVLKLEGVAAAELDVAIVDDGEIHRINREFLGHDWPTDVISFSYADQAAFVAHAWPRGQGLELDGELILSAETAVRMAAEHGWSADCELLLYGVHGCLHLCGYDDLSETERPLMRRREREVLAPWGLVPRHLEDSV